MLEQYFSNIWHKSKSEQFTVFFLTWDHPLPTIQWGELRQYGHIVCSNKDYLFHFKGLEMGVIVFLQKETGTKSVVMAMTMCFLWCDVMYISDAKFEEEHCSNIDLVMSIFNKCSKSKLSCILLSKCMLFTIVENARVCMHSTKCLFFDKRYILLASGRVISLPLNHYHHLYHWLSLLDAYALSFWSL